MSNSKQRLRITYLTDHFLPTSGADTQQLINMVSALSEKFEITLLSAISEVSESEKVIKIQQHYGIGANIKHQFVHLKKRWIRGVEKLEFAYKSVKSLNESIDIIYTRNLPVVLSTLWFTNKHILFETYRPWPSRNIQSRWLFNYLNHEKQFLGIILHSEFAKKAFVESGFDAKKLKVEHNAYENDFSDDLQDINALRKELNLPIDKLLVTYTGRVNPQKGLLKMLELAKHFPDIEFIIVGSEGEGIVEKEAKSVRNVRIIPWQPLDMTERYVAAADILYIPTSLTAREKARNTVLPIKTFMYKSSGKPILAPAIDDVQEVLKHNVSAYLVEPDNDNSAINGLKHLSESAELRQRLGSQAKKEMKKSTWSNRAQRVGDFINKMLKEIEYQE